MLTSVPGRFNTLHPSFQYSSICASVSADPRASFPCALQASTIRRTARPDVGCSALEMRAEARGEVRVAIGDHVDAVDGRDRLDIFQALERLDRHAGDDVGIGPWRILGGVAGAMAAVSGVHPLPRDTAIADRRIFCLPRDRPCLLDVIDIRDLDAA